jgi:hypothetical protein
MSTDLERRLLALESVVPPAPEHGEMTKQDAQRLSTAISALLTAFDWHGRHETLAALLNRLDTANATDDDRATLSKLPPCHVTPHELVRLVVEVPQMF